MTNSNGFRNTCWTAIALAMSTGLAWGATPLQADIVTGTLQLQWGDPQGGTGRAQPPAKLLATLVADDGERFPLDTAQSLRAAENLYALANKRIAVEFAADGRAKVEAIVSADNLASITTPDALAKAVALKALVTGTTRWITVACKFSDIATEQKPISFFQGQYGTLPGQLGHYWPDVSYGKINLTGSDAYGWFVLPEPRSFYVTKDSEGKDKANLDQLFKDCVAAADATVTFTGAQGINMMFNGDLDGFAWGGSACGVLDGASKCIRNTWNPPWSFNNVAPLSHEMGHGYGLPHSDNSDGDSDTYDNPWDVMSDSWSNAASDPSYGSLPKHINIIQRDRLGWVDAARKLTVATGASADHVALDFAHLAGSGNLQMITLPMATADASGNTVYVVEARARTLKATEIYESNLAGNAVIIHGQKSANGMAYSIDADVPPANRSNNEGSMFKVGETWTSPNGLQQIKVESQTTTGFVVTIGWPGPSTPPDTLKATVTRTSPRSPMSIEVRWTGGAPRMEVFRNGVLVRTTESGNLYMEKYFGGARPTFRVCNASTSTCSTTVTTQPLRVGGPDQPIAKPASVPTLAPPAKNTRLPRVPDPTLD